MRFFFLFHTSWATCISFSVGCYSLHVVSFQHQHFPVQSNIQWANSMYKHSVSFISWTKHKLRFQPTLLSYFIFFCYSSKVAAFTIQLFLQWSRNVMWELGFRKFHNAVKLSETSNACLVPNVSGFSQIYFFRANRAF